MSKLFKLTYSKSKSGKKTTIMIDTLCKCENYKKARSVQVKGFHEIVPANKEDSTYKKKSPKSGYITKSGYNEKTAESSS